MPKIVLKRLIGAPTALLIGMGVAIGSGIFRTPGEVANHIQTPSMVILIWVVAGVIVLMQSMVTAELATRYPHAGGEYVYLREAYGEFVAFFFGWAYTIFIIGGGAATIALAFGDFGCDLFSLSRNWSGSVAAGAIITITLVNAIGLRAGAGMQNAMTVMKIIAMMVLIGFGLMYTAESVVEFVPVTQVMKGGLVVAFLSALVPALWPYEGTTDAAKMAEEIKDVHRAIPRALIGSTLLVILIYILVNVALMNVVPLHEMRGMESVPGEAMARIFGPQGRRLMLIIAMVVCLGALSSTVLATVRVTYALARDGLTFRVLAKMSRSQSPVPALIVVACVSVFLVLMRNFSQVLQIYFFASAILFGLSYASLIIFRRRESSFPKQVFRCPVGPVLAVLLICIQLAIAVNIAYHQPKDVMYTVLMLITLVCFYFVWKRFNRHTNTSN